MWLVMAEDDERMALRARGRGSTEAAEQHQQADGHDPDCRRCRSHGTAPY